MSENSLSDYNSILGDTSYDNLSNEEKARLYFKVDNFLEALYISPQMFGWECIKLLKYREEKLTIWRRTSQVFAGISFISFYVYRRLKYSSGFYFRNYIILALGGGIISYFFGRLGELASLYNVTDEEIEELQLKVSEEFLKENKEQQTKRSSLDSVKFKV